jgi:hypothetical protein
VAVSREHRRAKTDRLDSELLKRAFLGWLRGDHCKMVAIPTAKDEDAKRPNRQRESLVGEQNRIITRIPGLYRFQANRLCQPNLFFAHPVRFSWNARRFLARFTIVGWAIVVGGGVGYRRRRCCS